MPRSPKDNEEIRRARRDAILAAATRVFERKGFAQTKVSDIAAEAQLSHGLVYHYFDSKEAVFAAIADAMMARVDADLAVPHERALDRVTGSLERHRARLEQPVDEQRIMMQAIVQGSIPAEVRERLTEHFAHVFSTLRGWIAEAQDQGDVDASVPADDLAAALICLVRGMSLRLSGMPELPFALPDTPTIIRLLLPRPAAGAPAPAKREVPKAAPTRKRGSPRQPRGTSDAKTRRPS